MDKFVTKMNFSLGFRSFLFVYKQPKSVKMTENQLKVKNLKLWLKNIQTGINAEYIKQLHI